MVRFCRHPWLLAASLLLGCQADDAPVDDGATPPAEAPDDPDAPRAECARAIERAATECPPSFTLDVIDFDEDPNQPPLDVIDLASASTPLPGGIYVPANPSLPSQPTLGHVLADNDACQVSCTIPCDVSRNDFCASSRADRPSCSFCGPPASLEQCEAFLAACE
jgi:hypothetical protein